MNNWPKVSLGDHVDLLAGFAFKSAQFTADPNDVPLIKGENIGQGKILWDISKRWPSSESHQYSRFELRKDDVVLAMDRPWVPAGLKYAWIKENDPKCLLVQRVARLRGVNGLDSRFLRFVIGSPQFTDYIKPIVTGVNVPHISGRQIEDFQFTLPPATAQSEIAEILSAYDDQIENNTRRIKILEEMAQALYREWFVDFRVTGHEKIKRVDSQMGKVPKGWDVRKVTEAVLVNPRTPVPKETRKPHVPMDSLATNSMLIGNVNIRTGNNGSKFKNGDTLFARITPCLENGKTAFVSFLPSDSDVAIGSTEFIVLRSKTLCPEYVYLMARSNEFRDNAIKSMSGATGRQRVQEKCFDKFLIAQPDKNTLEQFRSLTEPMFQLVHSLADKNKNLRRTRDLLLPKLISGELPLS